MDAAGDCYICDLPNREGRGMNMRQLTVELALASACMFIASCSSTPPPPPVAAEVLDGLLLSPAEINTAMGATGITVSGTSTDMSDDSANVPDKDCRFLYSAETSVYNGSGWTGMRSQDLHEPGDDYDHEVWQAVVSFPAANDAARFFSASAQRWPACSNRQFHYIAPGQPDKVWTVGPIANTNGTLSTTETLENGYGWACQRALTVRNNVAIDVMACSVNPAHAAVFNIADQIAAKVAKL
jgi:serine/threonine kinase PknH